MAFINSVDPPPLNDQDYVDKINNSLNAIDGHDHTIGKGVPLPAGAFAAGAIDTGDIADGAITNIKIAGGIDLTSKVTGVLPVANGGTGSAMRNFVDLVSSESISGVKTFANIIASAELSLIDETVSTPGAITALTVSNVVVRLSGASSLAGIVAPSRGRMIALINAALSDITLLNESGTATSANRILTGSGSDFRFKAGALAILIYDLSAARWLLLGGGGGGSLVQSNFTGTSITLSADLAQKFRYTGGSAQTATFVTTSAVDGSTVEVMGTSDTNTVTIDPSASVVINGQWVGHLGSTLSLRWDSGLSAMVEVSRNGI